MRRLGIAVLIALAALLATVALRALGAIDRLEAIALDARYASGLGRKPATSDVVIAWIDQKSLDYMAANGVPFPWPREVYGQALQYLRKCGARAVAFDLVLDQQNGTAEDARAFGKTLADGRGDALAMKFVNYRDGGLDDTETAAFAQRALALDATPVTRPRERGVVLPLPEFAAGADRLGFVNIAADADGTFRRYDLLRPWGRKDEPAKLYPSLALATLLAANEPGQLAWRGDALRLPDGTVTPCGAAARVLLNLRGPAFTFAKVMFVNILESINLADEGKPPLHAPDAFRDKIVLVGIHAEGLEDAHPTPLDAHLPGVELHATAIDNLLHGDAFTVPDLELPLALLAALLAAATVFVLPGVVRPAAALAMLALAAAGAVAWAWLALLAVPVAAPFVAGSTAAAGSFLWRLVVEGRQKREMRRAFQSYLAPEVLAEVLRDPSALRLGGETREVTLFFTDLQGFTSLAERSQPQELVAFLNDYFTRMCAPVLAERGIIDKFIGDAIMAIFGAPAAQPAHGAAAVRAAVAALAVSDEIAGELRTRGLPPIATRVGIHRGTAVVGNMGSASRFDYTAIGDTVNLASRLEGANKAFGTRCLVSETAWADVGDTVLGREVGRITVVGRHEPIRVFEPLALREQAPHDVAAFATHWLQAMQAFATGDRAAARPHFEACAEARPDDALTTKWLAGLADRNFQGVFPLDHK